MDSETRPSAATESAERTSISRAAHEPVPKENYDKKVKPRRNVDVLLLFLFVFGAQFAFGMWMNSRGFLWNDALSRATSALTALYSTDPHLAAIGFVWMPLPTLLELMPAAFYTLWPDVVASGLVSTVVTAFAGGGTAALLLFASGAFGISRGFAWVFALLVSLNPMLFLFAGNGMSEGVAAPFLVGTVCCLTLFWRTGQRRYVAAAALMLALAFACLYHAVQYGAAAFAALTLSIFFSGENARSVPQGRWRALEGLGILFLVPSIYVAALWVGANAVIMGDPLYFARSAYSNEGVVAATGAQQIALGYEGDLLGSMWFVAERTAPFLVPVVFLLIIRAMEGRLLGVNTLSLLLISLSVPVGLIAPQIYAGDSFGWLRYFMYPLFVAAGWGMYEIAMSRRRALAAGLVLAGWIVCAPLVFWTMWNPAMGQDEYKQVRGLVRGETAAQVGFGNEIDDSGPVANKVDESNQVAVYLNYLPEDELVALDSLDGWPIVAQTSPERLQSTLVLGTDRRFRQLLENPGSLNYMLVPNPEVSSRDLIVQRYPGLWAGEEPGFTLVKSFPDTSRQWRLYEVE